MRKPLPPPGERAEARKEGDPVTLLMGQPHEVTTPMGQATHNRPKGVLRTLVLSQLLVTFLWREKSPAGGKTPNETPSGTDKKAKSPVRE